MTVLFGHPTGNPNSHNAALAHLEAGWLEALCVPWVPSAFALKCLSHVPRLKYAIGRLSRRRFAPLANAPMVQGRMGEFWRLLMRGLGTDHEKFAYQANDWLMHTMAREIERRRPTVVHSYEDCSLWQFQKAKKSGAACVYDMPIGYYPVWKRTEDQLARRYSDWLPEDNPGQRHVRPSQKTQELELADLVLAPSTFVLETVKEHFPNKPIALARYGVAADFWTPVTKRRPDGSLTFLCVGHVSLRKGVPDLLQAWSRAGLKDARLLLVGKWRLSQRQFNKLPGNVTWVPPCSPTRLRELYRGADIFVFPSHFEGFGLVLLEAMACGLPAIATTASAMPDFFTGNEGLMISPGDLDALVGALRWASDRRDRLPQMGGAARMQVETLTWTSYRGSVRDAVAPLV